MTLPSEAQDSLGRGGEVGPDPVAGRWRHALRWLIVVAFACRAGLAVLEVRSVATAGMRTLPLVSSVSFGSSSLVWPALWGALAFVAAAALALRVRAGWLLGVAVAVAYLVAGISDVSALSDTFGADLASGLETIGVGLGVPLVMLAGLVSIRVWYLPSSRPLGAARARVRQATPPALYRWRRRT